jgi:hypothetical protein
MASVIGGAVGAAGEGMHAMGYATEGALDLDEAAREELITLVVRGMIRGELSSATQLLVERGLAVVKGTMVIPVGSAAQLAGELLRLPAGSDAEARVRELFEVFLPLNRRLRDLCTAWQCRPDGSPNDHSDSSYDAAVRDRLDDIDDAAGAVLARMGAVCERLAGYRARLTDALDRLDAGQTQWLASPMLDSYHTVWMHLHQELLLALDISRAEDEALEERLVGRSAR